MQLMVEKITAKSDISSIFFLKKVRLLVEKRPSVGLLKSSRHTEGENSTEKDNKTSNTKNHTRKINGLGKVSNIKLQV